MRKLLLAVLVLMFGALSPALAQDTPALELGVPLTASLDSGSGSVTYTLAGSAGQTIYVVLGSQDFAGALRLVAPSGVAVGQSDDNVSGMSVVGPVTLPSDGDYTVLVSRPDWETSGGDYLLLADMADVLPVQPDTPVHGHLDSQGAIKFFTYSGTAGDLISYGAHGATIRVMLTSPTGNGLFSDSWYDDLGRFFVPLPDTGPYVGLIQTLNDGGTDFDLTVGPVHAQTLTPGQPLSGSFTESHPAIFSFDSDAEKLWQLNASFDPQDGGNSMQIHLPSDPNYYGGPLVEDCCSGPNNSPRIDPFTAPQDGTYYVILNHDDYDPGTDSSVNYTISLAPSTLVSLAPGSAVTGTVSPDTGTARYAYDGEQGQVITITLEQTGGNGNPGLNIFSPDDQILSFNGPAATGATFDLVLPTTGMYLFEVFNVSYDGDTIDFSIQLDAKQ